MKELDKTYIDSMMDNSKFSIRTVGKVTSTNALMKEAAQNGEREFSVLIASEQTAGRGRMGRDFFSPDASGLYMSILIRPDDKRLCRITTDAAVSCACALERLSGKNTYIKWVNDIYINNRKVCGILAESSMENNRYVVLGIGVNITMPKNGFPEDISDRAGCVYDIDKPYLREKTAAEILKEFYRVYTCGNEEQALLIYREKSIVTGKSINILKPTGEERATALGIDDDYALIVKNENGAIEKLSFGDVSIRI